MKAYHAPDWYWTVAGGATRYSSAVGDYVPTTDASYVEWISDGTAPSQIDSEYNLGLVLGDYAPDITVPLPSGVRAGYNAKLAIKPRTVLAANRTYYVNTSGLDSNDGLSPTNAEGGFGPFKTIQKAIDAAVALDLSVYSVTIQCADGTYTGAVKFKSYVGVGPIGLRGNPANTAACIISTTSVDAILAAGVLGAYRLGGFKIQTTTAGIGILATNGSQVFINEAMEFGACAIAHIAVTTGAAVEVTGNIKVSGSSSYHIFMLTGGRLIFSTMGTTVVGTLSFADFVAVDNLACINAGGWALSHVGATVTGRRYSVSQNSVINTGGGGESFFPGNTPGVKVSGGLYA